MYDTNELAEHLKVSTGTLRRWRGAGRGPKWFRLGAKAVRYREADVEAWLEEQQEGR